jgi:APA family basic amino acid/polyamine antiporter
LGRKLIPAAGLAGCILLAVLLPIGSVLVGAGVVLIGALGYWLRRQYSS